MSITIIVIYTIAITLLFFYCIMQLSLAIHYIKFKRNLKKEETIFTIPESEYPHVTVQLPVFNELYVVERLIDAIAAFDYPADKLEIQLLDDSTDESFEIARKKWTSITKKVSILNKFAALNAKVSKPAPSNMV